MSEGVRCVLDVFVDQLLCSCLLQLLAILALSNGVFEWFRMTFLLLWLSCDFVLYKFPQVTSQ